MVNISPFAGLRFNPEKIQNRSTVISPPYDKISTPERRILWDRDKNNVVRLILPPPSDSDIDVMTHSTADESANWYEDAANRFQQWIHEGILNQDSPQFYMYRQTFSYEDKVYTRKGFFCALLLDEEKGAFAHENTFEGPKADRLRLTRATQANMSPIFLLADGDINEWEKLFGYSTDELLHIQDFENQDHILYGIQDQNAIQELTRFFENRTLVIADGHHRFETALNYRREMMEQTGKDPKQEPWGWVFAFVTPMNSSELLVLPTHRVLKDLPDQWFTHLCETAAEHCTIEPVNNLDTESIRTRITNTHGGQGIVAVSQNEAVLLTINSSGDIPALLQVPEPIRELNVSILHQYIFEVCLRLSKEELLNRTRYVRGENEAISMVRQGEYDAAFLLGGISPKKVFEASLEGVRMPQKSTDFYPKIPTGLVIRSLT